MVNISVITNISNILINGKESTINRIAAFYNASNETVRTIVKRNKFDFDTYNEIRVLNGNDLKMFKESYKCIKKGIPQISLINTDGIIRIGLLMQDNDYSEKLKEEILNNGVPEKFKDIFSKKNHNTLKKQFSFYELISKSLLGVFQIDKQVHIGKYRVDLLLDKYIVLECDEFGHMNYNQEVETLREQFLINHGYKIFRFNPDSDDCPLELINKIIRIKLRTA